MIKELNTPFTRRKKMKKQKAIKTQPKQNFFKFLIQNHIDGSSSEDDKPWIFLTKSIQETDVVKDPTYRPNINGANSSDSEYSENQSERERASTKEKKIYCQSCRTSL